MTDAGCDQNLQFASKFGLEAFKAMRALYRMYGPAISRYYNSDH